MNANTHADSSNSIDNDVTPTVPSYDLGFRESSKENTSITLLKSAAKVSKKKGSGSNLAISEEIDSIVSSETEGPDTHSAVSSCSSETGGPDSEQYPSDDETQVYHDERHRGMIIKQGEHVSFVADNLNEQIKLVSPNASARSQSSRRSSLTSTDTHLPIDPKLLSEIEQDAHKLSQNITDMLYHLQEQVHTMSAITVGCIQTNKSAVDKTVSQVDANTKVMYKFVARCEELNQKFKLMYPVADEIHKIMKILDMFEHELHITKPS